MTSADHQPLGQGGHLERVVPEGSEAIRYRPVVMHGAANVGGHQAWLSEALGNVVKHTEWRKLGDHHSAPTRQDRILLSGRGFEGLVRLLIERGHLPDFANLPLAEATERIFPTTRFSHGDDAVDLRVGVLHAGRRDRVTSEVSDHFLVFVERPARLRPHQAFGGLQWGRGISLDLTGEHRFFDVAISALDPRFGPHAGRIAQHYGKGVLERDFGGLLPRRSDPQKEMVFGLRRRAPQEDLHVATRVHRENPDLGVELAARIESGTARSAAMDELGGANAPSEISRILGDHQSAIASGDAPAEVTLASRATAASYIDGTLRPSSAVNHVRGTYAATLRELGLSNGQRDSVGDGSTPMALPRGYRQPPAGAGFDDDEHPSASRFVTDEPNVSTEPVSGHEPSLATEEAPTGRGPARRTLRLDTGSTPAGDEGTSVVPAAREVAPSARRPRRRLDWRAPTEQSFEAPATVDGSVLGAGIHGGGLLGDLVRRDVPKEKPAEPSAALGIAQTNSSVVDSSVVDVTTPTSTPTSSTPRRVDLLSQLMTGTDRSPDEDMRGASPAPPATGDGLLPLTTGRRPRSQTHRSGGQKSRNTMGAAVDGPRDRGNRL